MNGLNEREKQMFYESLDVAFDEGFLAARQLIEKIHRKGSGEYALHGRRLIAALDEFHAAFKKERDGKRIERLKGKG